MTPKTAAMFGDTGERLLLVLDFDGFLLNSYELLHTTMASFGLDVGDEQRFKNRRKFLKYFGGGKELLHNLIGMSLPKTRKLRDRLTETYIEEGRVYPPLASIVNRAIANPQIHCGILSRNFTLNPGPTIRQVLHNSGIDEEQLDFVVPLPVGIKKTDVLEGMRASRYAECVLGADEVGDYHAAHAAQYVCLMASYGFDTRERLIEHGEIPPDNIFDSPTSLAASLSARLSNYSAGIERSASSTRQSSAFREVLMGAR